MFKQQKDQGIKPGNGLFCCKIVLFYVGELSILHLISLNLIKFCLLSNTLTVCPGQSPSFTSKLWLEYLYLWTLCPFRTNKSKVRHHHLINDAVRDYIGVCCSRSMSDLNIHSTSVFISHKKLCTKVFYMTKTAPKNHSHKHTREEKALDNWHLCQSRNAA